jgi:fused signal recognition particle receptor
MSFFRRLRRTKEEPAADAPERDPSPAPDEEGVGGLEADRPTPVDEEPSAATPAERGAVVEAPAPAEVPFAAAAAPLAAPPAVAPPPDPVGRPAAPPPLPHPAAAPTAAAHSQAAPFSLCFVCGGPLEGKHCPTCRMTWVE